MDYRVTGSAFKVMRDGAGGNINKRYQVKYGMVILINSLKSEVGKARVDSKKLHIQKAQPSDAPLLRSLGIQTYREHFADIWSPIGLEVYLERHFAIGKLQDDLASEQCLYLLGSDAEGTPLGFAKVNWNVRVPEASDALFGTELEKIYFRRVAVGRGYGKQLINAVFEAGQAQNSPRIWLDVLKTNERARDFYEQLHFRIVGELPFATDTREVGMWLMVR